MTWRHYSKYGTIATGFLLLRCHTIYLLLLTLLLSFCTFIGLLCKFGHTQIRHVAFIIMCIWCCCLSGSLVAIICVHVYILLSSSYHLRCLLVRVWKCTNYTSDSIICISRHIGSLILCSFYASWFHTHHWLFGF